MSIINFIGNTPIVRLENPHGEKYGHIYVKLEEFNPGGSHKSRVAMQMIEDAEVSGKLKKGDIILEATGGNTGIGLCIAAAIKGYHIVLTIPDTFSLQKNKLLQEYGAEVILADHKLGNDCHIRKAIELANNNANYYWIDQFSNPSNPKAHYYGTGKEIFDQMQGNIDYFIAGVGSGGTIMGVGKRLKELKPKVKVIAVQPEGCDIRNGIYIPHKIEAIAVGKTGKFIDFNLINSYESVNYEEVIKLRQYLMKNHGLNVGISAGANILVALRISKEVDNQTNIVTIAADSGTIYL